MKKLAGQEEGGGMSNGDKVALSLTLVRPDRVGRATALDIRRRGSVHVWRGCAHWLTFSVRSGMHLDWRKRKKKRIYTPQIREGDKGCSGRTGWRGGRETRGEIRRG